MKALNILLFFLFIALSGCAENPIHIPPYIPSPSVKPSIEITYKMAQKLSEKHQMKVSGDIAGMPGGIIHALGLMFDVHKPLSQDELRVILVDCVEEFLAEMNSNEEIRPFLEHFPAEPKNVTIIIIVSTEKKEKIYEPGICAADASNGKLHYNMTTKKKKYGYTKEYTETFEEAKQMISQQNSKDLRTE